MFGLSGINLAESVVTRNENLTILPSLKHSRRSSVVSNAPSYDNHSDLRSPDSIQYVYKTQGKPQMLVIHGMFNLVEVKQCASDNIKWRFVSV